MDRIQQIHDASMKILEKTGIKYLHEEALEIFKKNGARVEGDVVYMTEDEIMGWIKKAPSSFKLYARNPKYDIEIGGDKVLYAHGCGAPIVVGQDGHKKPATVEDYVKMSKLFHTNERFCLTASAAACPQDIDAYYANLTYLYMDYMFSDKAMFMSAGDTKQMEASFEMIMAACGVDKKTLMEKPMAITIINAITPLRYDTRMVDTLVAMAKCAQPIIINSAGMAGTTSPVTLAGTIAVVNAEVISGIVLTQMINPGTPVMYGTQTAIADLRNGSMAIGSAEGALCYKYGAQLAKFYGLPCRGGGALSDAKIVDAQAGLESMITLMACKENKMNLVVHSAGILDGFSAMSYEKVILDFEVVEFVERYYREFDINEETLPLELIDEIGHEGQYLTDMHTLEFCRKEPYTPIICVRGATDNPQQFMVNIEKRLNYLMDTYKMPENDPAVIAKMKEIMKDFGVSDAEVAKIDACIGQ